MIGLRSSVPILAALCAALVACSPAGPAGSSPSASAQASVGSQPPGSAGASAGGSSGPSSAAVASPAIGSPAAPSPSTGASPSPQASPTPKEVAMPFSLRSSAFRDGSAIPRRYTCDGPDVSPALDWEGAPDGTASLALIVDDPDARGFVHWVAFDLTGAATGGLPEGFSSSPDAPPQGTNGFGRVGYGGPCPPSGTHRYVFTLYALDRMLGLAGAPRADAVRAAMKGHILGEAQLLGTYRR